MNKPILFYLLLMILWLPIRAGEHADTDIKVITFDELQKDFQTGDDAIYVYNFWATWCSPCVKEIPAFEQLHQNFKDQNVKVVLVSLDFMSQLESHVIPFLTKNNLQSEVVLLNAPNYNAWINLVDEGWSGSIPATMVLDKRTKERQFFEKQLDYQDLNSIILSLLNQ